MPFQKFNVCMQNMQKEYLIILKYLLWLISQMQRQLVHVQYTVGSCMEQKWEENSERNFLLLTLNFPNEITFFILCTILIKMFNLSRRDLHFHLLILKYYFRDFGPGNTDFFFKDFLTIVIDFFRPLRIFLFLWIFKSNVLCNVTWRNF